MSLPKETESVFISLQEEEVKPLVEEEVKPLVEEEVKPLVVDHCTIITRLTKLLNVMDVIEPKIDAVTKKVLLMIIAIKPSMIINLELIVKNILATPGKNSFQNGLTNEFILLYEYIYIVNLVPKNKVAITGLCCDVLNTVIYFILQEESVANDLEKIMMGDLQDFLQVNSRLINLRKEIKTILNPGCYVNYCTIA